MDNTYWHKQTIDKPIFPDLLWSRPESRQSRGKLLIIGGNAHGFVAPAEAFRDAEKAGAGTVRMVIPDSLKQFTGKTFTAGELAPSTPSGSFARASLAAFLENAAWADGVLLPGDLGHNSETAIVLESFLEKYKGQATLAKDAIDYWLTAPATILDRPKTVLIVTMAELQKLATNARFGAPFTLGMDLLHLVEGLHTFTAKHAASLIVKHHNQVIVAVDGQVSSTILKEDLESWRVKTAAHAAVWLIQNPEKPFEALTASAC